MPSHSPRKKSEKTSILGKETHPFFDLYRSYFRVSRTRNPIFPWVRLLVFSFCPVLALMAQNKPVPIEISEVENYSAPSSVYSLKIGGLPVPVNAEICNDMPKNGGKRVVHTAVFDYPGAVPMEIEMTREPESVSISPLRLKLPFTQEGKKIKFVMPKTFNLAILTGLSEPLFLFSAPPATPPKKGEPGVVYFEKGTHDVGLLEVKSDTTYFLEKGAVVRGKVLMQGVRNVKIVGRGMFDSRKMKTGGNMIKIYNCTNITFEGFGIRCGVGAWSQDPRNTENFYARYLNLLSFGKNNDGLDVGTGCQNFLFRDCFIGCGDDGFGWHATDGEKDGEVPSTNLEARDCLVWKTYPGNGIRIGSSMETSYFSDLRFVNIDFAYLEDGYAIISDHSDWAALRGVFFENVFNETKRPFLKLELAQTRYTNPKGYRAGSMSNIQFINCSSVGQGVTLNGFDPTHRIEEVRFKNVMLGGQPLAPAGITKNEYVSGVRVE